MKIGVVGNREGWSKEFVFRVLQDEELTEDDTIISGGAQGVDSIAEEFAKLLGCKLIVHRPDMNIAYPYRFRQRNKKIAVDCDKLIAFDKRFHSGTSQTIRFAKELGKEVKVINEENKIL
ncbi:MAG: DUF2493 domain-containing protein [Actinobacteria bacterium]|nr:DUF2493 domain-containing protein [Actinomycetota bacterium]